MKGKEATKSKRFGDTWWDVVVKNEAENTCEGVEAGLGSGLTWGGQAIGLESVGQVTERAVGCAWLKSS
jgi:hypothetical protein